MAWQRAGWLVVVIAAVARWAAGCAGEESAERACVPGTTLGCVCPGDAHGIQTCLADGTGYGECADCVGAGGSGGADGGSGGAPGGSGGASGGSGGASGGSGGASGGSGGNAGSGGAAGAGGFGPLVCVDLATVSPVIDFPACDVASQEQCLCEGCTPDEICFDSGLHLADDCVCPDCAADRFCTDLTHCNADGLCNPYFEGCACADCAAHPLCN